MGVVAGGHARRVDVGSGVIGRLDEEVFEPEELPMAGPSRRARPDDKRRRPEEKKHAWADLQQVMKVFGKEPKRS